MPNQVSVCSMFRDSQEWQGNLINQVGRFFIQMQNQAKKPDEMCLLEGDSSDNTYNALKDFVTKTPIKCCLIKKDEPGGQVHSVDTAERLIRLSKVANTALKMALAGKCERVLWVESDLIIPTCLIEKLTKHMDKVGCQAIAPTIFLANSPIFYDSWGFVDIDGENVSNHDWARVLSKNLSQQIPALSVGSCVLMDANFLRKHQILFDENCFKGLCSQIRNRGGSVYIDKNYSVQVYHPSSALVNNRWI